MQGVALENSSHTLFGQFDDFDLYAIISWKNC